jgi:hypothetical protein
MTWQNARFNHAGIVNGCVKCHLKDFNPASNPMHAGVGPAPNCESCHSTRGWRPAMINHRFPLSGPHNVACNQCHTSPGTYKTFNCLNCHPHSDKAKTDSAHVGKVSGYVYASTACYTCHPNGRH